MRAHPATALLVAFLLVFGAARAASAQQVVPFLPPVQPSAQPQPEAARAQPAAADSQSVSAVVSLARIRRLLREQPPLQTDSKLRLQFHVEVVGRMPRLDIMSGFNIDKRSAVPYGGMTHAEFLHIVAPPWRKW
jgi:hypothetical protein